MKRENKVVDIIRRVGVISGKNVHLTNFPIDHPTTIFNPGLLIEEDVLEVYGRITVGYYMHPYASAIAKFQIPLDDLQGDLSNNVYSGELAVIPDTEHDMWGVEDPRATVVNGRKVLVYCGLTRDFHNPSVKYFRNMPTVAIYENGEWRKVGQFRLKGAKIFGDKDAFLVEMNGLKLFQRPTMEHEGKVKDLCVISKVPENALESSTPKEIETYDGIVPIDKEKFEHKIGWGTPPLKIGKEYLLFLHAAGLEDAVYRAFAVLMDEGGKITAVTPYYIMAPREPYEKYGDRPHVVFPSGIGLLDDEVIVVYGAADSFIGIGKVDLSEIMSILDSNRI
nr:hypothetical protein [Thermococcus sp. MV5]